MRRQLFCPQGLVVLLLGSFALIEWVPEKTEGPAIAVCGPEAEDAEAAAIDPRLAGLWQRFGRAGRRKEGSIAVLVQPAIAIVW